MALSLNPAREVARRWRQGPGRKRATAQTAGGRPMKALRGFGLFCCFALLLVVSGCVVAAGPTVYVPAPPPACPDGYYWSSGYGCVPLPAIISACGVAPRQNAAFSPPWNSANRSRSSARKAGGPTCGPMPVARMAGSRPSTLISAFIARPAGFAALAGLAALLDKAACQGYTRMNATLC